AEEKKKAQIKCVRHRSDPSLTRKRSRVRGTKNEKAIVENNDKGGNSIYKIEL
ncbi:hypothetical protein S245_008540, partial [Arachis hypogaea]